MASPTPSSGRIYLTQIKNAFPNVNSNHISSYRNRVYYRPGTPNTGRLPSGQISFSNFYNKIYLQVPRFKYQNANYNLGSRYPFGGCAGSGWKYLKLRLINGRLYLAMAGVANDYYWQYGSNTGAWYNPSPWEENYRKYMLGGGPRNTWSGGWGVDPYGRDNTSFRLRTDISGYNLYVRIYEDCKGGAWGWRHVYSVYVPIVWGNP